LPENALRRQAEYKTEEAERNKQRVECRNLQVFQILQRQINYGAGVGILRNGMTEAASGFKPGAHIGEIDKVVAC